MPSRVLLTMASLEETTMAASRASAFSASASKVTHRVPANSPSWKRPFEVMRTSRREPSFFRSLAGRPCMFSPFARLGKNIADDVLIRVKLGDVASDVVLGGVAEQI